MKKLIIVCTGDYAREVYWHAQNSKGYGTEFVIKGFLEGNVPLKSEYKLFPMPVIDNVINYKVHEDDAFVIANSNCHLKEALAEILEKKNAKFYNLIHNTAQVASRTKLGCDIIIGPFCMISVDVVIGNHVMLNCFDSLGHDVVIGDFTSIMSHVDITGKTLVGNHTYWGSGSRALPSSKIGNHTKIGAGSVVLKKVKDGQTVFGVPAMPI